MIFGNLNYFVVLIFILLLISGGFLLWKIFLLQRHKFKVSFLVLSLFFLIINIFEIKGGYNDGIDIVDAGKIVFVLDVSKSMNVEDISDNKKSFSRLNLSKDIIKNYITNNINNDYGLMIFAGETLEVLPFTNNPDIFSTILYGVNNTNISKFGTNLNSVFSSLENYFLGDDEGGLVVIFSDLGDEKIEINKEQLKTLEKKGIKILLVGVGSEKGGKIPDGNDFFGGKMYKTYNGHTIVSMLNISELKNITSKYDIDGIMLDNVNDYHLIDEYITKNIKKIGLEKHIYNRIDLTRFFVLISFIFFILFLYTDNFIGKEE